MRDVKLEGLSRDGWLRVGRMGIGGSDVGAIMRQSPWATPLDVYLDKIGEAEPLEESDRMKAGRYLEPAIAEMFKDGHPELKVVADTKMRVHPKYDFMLANTDRLIKDEDGDLGVLEIKTASSWYSKTWEDGSVPIQYYMQLQWYLNILDAKFGYFAILIDGYDYVEYLYERDDVLIAKMEDAVKCFWLNNVKKRQPPEPMSDADLKLLYPEETQGSELEADMLDMMHIKEYLQSKEDESRAKASKDKMAHKIKARMKDNEFLVDNGFVVASLRKNKKGTRVLSVKNLEE